MDLISYATKMAEAGVSVGPAVPEMKRPSGSWKERQSKRLEPDEVAEHFGDAKGMCVFTGPVSGHVEMIDFDCRAVDYQEWYSKVDEKMPGLLADIVVERSQSGGKHVIYRATNGEGSQKLCTRVIQCEDTETHEFKGKEYTVQHLPDGRYAIEPCTIETRGNGGLFLCHPTPGYRLEQGSLTDIKMVSEEERNVMIEIARAMSDKKPVVPAPKEIRKPTGQKLVGTRPGDLYNQSGELQHLLRTHGWTYVGGKGENEYWRRPGKNKGNHSATYKDGCFFVFSSNAPPFEPNTGYTPFAVYAMLEHGGDFNVAASALEMDAYSFDTAKDLGVELDGIMNQIASNGKTAQVITPSDHEGEVIRSYDPRNVVMDADRLNAEVARRKGEKDYDLGRYAWPGLIKEMCETSLRYSPKPNPTLAFAAAITFLATVSGRKFRDVNNNRTNIYVVGLAESSQGKEIGRTFNAMLAEEIGCASIVRRKFASAEGIEDQLVVYPSMLYQVDEIQGIIDAMKGGKDLRSQNIMHTLMEMYSSAQKMFTGRSRAGDKPPVQIDQPCLCIYGTSIPVVFFGGMSTKMLDNGFFGRFIVLEAPHVRKGYEPGIIEIPNTLIDPLKTLWEYKPAIQGVGDRGLIPDTVRSTDCADRAIVEAQCYAEDQEHKGLKVRGDRTAVVWGKACENVRKLSLLYAISRDPEEPHIDNEAICAARDIIFDSCHQMQESARVYITDSDEEKQIANIRDLIKSAGKNGMSKRDLYRKGKIKKRALDEVLVTLMEQEFVAVDKAKTPTGRETKRFIYRHD